MRNVNAQCNYHSFRLLSAHLIFIIVSNSPNDLIIFCRQSWSPFEISDDCFWNWDFMRQSSFSFQRVYLRLISILSRMGLLTPLRSAPTCPFAINLWRMVLSLALYIRSQEYHNRARLKMLLHKPLSVQSIVLHPVLGLFAFIEHHLQEAINGLLSRRLKVQDQRLMVLLVALELGFRRIDFAGWPIGGHLAEQAGTLFSQQGQLVEQAVIAWVECQALTGVGGGEREFLLLILHQQLTFRLLFITSVMSLLRNAGLNLFRSDRVPISELTTSEAQAKRQRQLQYMRELDKQIEEKQSLSKSKSKSKSNSRGKKEMGSSMVSNRSAGRSHFAQEHEKYSKSAVLEQMLKMDYQTFKRNRPIDSRSRSKKKYRFLEEIGNQAQYKPIPQYKTIFVDSHGKEIPTAKQTIDQITGKSQKLSNFSRSKMRDDKNFSPQSVQKSQQQENRESEYSNTFQNQSENPVEKSERPETVQSKHQLSPLKSQNQNKIQDIPDVKLEEIWKINSLFIAHKLSRGDISDRLSTAINQNKHRFPQLFLALKNKSIQKELNELGQIINVIVKNPTKQHPRSSSVGSSSPPPIADQLIQIKDIISEIEKIAKPSYQRPNRFVDKDIELNQKINKRLGLDRHFNNHTNGTKKRQNSGGKKGLDELIERYEMMANKKQQ